MEFTCSQLVFRINILVAYNNVVSKFNHLIPDSLTNGLLDVDQRFSITILPSCLYIIVNRLRNQLKHFPSDCKLFSNLLTILGLRARFDVKLTQIKF